MSLSIVASAAVVAIGASRPLNRISPPARRRGRWWLVMAVPLIVVLTKGAAVVGAGAMILGLVVWKLLMLRRRKARTAAAESTAKVLGSLVSAMRAGASPHDAVDRIADNPPPELAEICATAAHRSAAGVSPGNLFAQAPDPFTDLQSAGKLWLTAERRGIPVAGLLEYMQHRIDAHLRHARASRAALQGPQATAVILAILPLAGIAMGAAMGANPWHFFTSTSLGGIFLLVGTALACGGFIWVDRIIAGAIR